MKSVQTAAEKKRLEALQNILVHERDRAYARIRDYRREQDEDAPPPPSDELDTARALADVETHASLIERAEYRLKAIDAAMSRAAQGRYGLCDECGEEIPVERLEVLPFAAYCVDCQTKRNHRLRPGEGYIDEPSRSLWTLPEEMDESLEKSDALTGPDEQLMVRDRGPFGPEVGEFEQMPPTSTARRRGRPRKSEKTDM